MSQLSTLVWKNFKYCKRHPLKTALFFLFPLLLSVFLFMVVALMETDDIPDCDYQTVALAPSSPEMMLGSLVCQTEEQCIRSKYYFPPHGLELIKNMSMSSICAGFPLHLAVDVISNGYWDKICNKEKEENKKIVYRNLLTTELIFKGKIYYYVNTTSGAKKTDADKIMKVAQSYLEAIPTMDYPELVNLTKPMCFVPINERTFYAESEEAALEAARNLDEYTDFVWGMVDFIATDKHYQYKIVTQHRLRNKMSTLYLQSMIEAAIIEVETGQKPFLEQKLLPKRCKKNPAIYGPTFSVISMVLGLGFVVTAYTISSEMCFEKQAGLLEFLFIAGVPQWKVRLSWLIFGSVFFVLTSLVLSCVFKFVSPLLFEYTPLSLIIIFMVLYSMSLLCLCVSVASLASTAQRASILVFVILMACYLAPQWGQMVPDVGYTGGTLMLVKLVSFLLGPFSAQIGFAYLVAMEQAEIGITWTTLRSSPAAEDMYGGVAEVMFYFILQCPLYLLLAWYFDKTSPSKYGLKWPLWFCCMPSFWGCNEQQHTPANQVKSENHADIEPVVSDKTPGISVQSLTKKYGNKFVAVNRLSVSFYQNEITAFLGHNGAGKSTTMNMLTGMISPSSGTAVVDGYDIWRNMKEIRQQLGFCPQYDIVYPELSVTEHMIFYGDLKGISREEVQKSSNILFEQMKMMHALDTPAMSLSGGMKRKLSIAIAFIGNPTTVILDEPTSAIDPFSRRAIWDAVLQYRSKATVLISTHYMQEADVLGDKIAIIDQGELKCFGSPMYLKTRYGDGSKITIAHDGAIDDKALEAELQAHVPVKLQSGSSSESTYTIPIEAARSEKLVDAFQYLEQSGDQWKILSFGISESTMEQVFFNVAEGGGTKEHHDNGKSESMLGKVEYINLNGCSLVMMQVWATLVKRFHISRKSIAALIFQVLTPLLFMGILYLFNRLIASAGLSGEKDIMHIWKTSSADRNVFFLSLSMPQNEAMLNVILKEGLGTKCTTGTLVNRNNAEGDMGYKCLNISGIAAPNMTEDGEMMECECSKCAKDAVLSADNVTVNSNDTFINLYSRNITNYLLKTSENGIIGGIEAVNMFGEKMDKASAGNSSLSGPKMTTMMANEANVSLSGPRLTTMMANAVNDSLSPSGPMDVPQIFRIWTGVKIENARSPSQYETDMQSMKAAFLNAYSNLLLKSANLNNADEYGITLYTEEETLNKEVSVADTISGILLGFFGHFALLFPTFTVLLVIVNERSAGNKQLQIVMGLNKHVYWISNFIWDMILFLFSVCLMIAFMSIFPDVFDTKLYVFFLISMLYGCSMILFSYVLSFLFNTARNAIMVIGNIAPFIGIACMVLLAFRTYEWYEDVNFGMTILPPYFITEALIAMEFNKVIPDSDPVLSWDVLGKRFVMSGIFSLLMLTLLICLESQLFTSMCQCMKGNNVAVGHSENNNDPDVAKEEEKILQQQMPETQALVVQQLVKSYGKHVAVKGVTFGVSKGECFGLLGVNGAGKTTLFKMLTRFHNPTRGDARILGHSVFKHGAEASKHMSYCPQEDCIFETLTAAEHLHLYGRIKGIPGDQRDEAVELLIEEVGLGPHRKKQSHSLSGGNKRKLNFAISMIDFPDVIFLDEMTTGMDPKARRAAWMCLERAVARGCAAVITSHSMEECEALCNRLVIMVNGTFKCIGGVQYLKDKYGNNYNAKFRLGPNADAQKLSHGMLDKFGLAKIVEEHLGFLELQIPADSLQLSSLFKAIHVFKDECEIEEFSVSQTTLEHVFVNMVRDQE